MGGIKDIADVRDYRDLLEMEEMVGVDQEKIVEALETKAVQLECNEAYRRARIGGKPDCKYTLLFHKDCTIPLKEYFDKQKQNDATEKGRNN